MMYDISVNENDLRDTSTVCLEGLKKRIEEELQRRRNLERELLIEGFKEAWYCLKDFGVHVTYCEEFDDDAVYLDDWDGFSFD